MFSTLFWFLIAAIAIAGIAFVGFVVWVGERTKEREALYRSETIKKIAESGNSAAAMEFLRETEKAEAERGRTKARVGGLITAAVSVALIIFLHEIAPGTAVYLAGLIPLFVGVSLLIFSELLMKPKG